MPSTKDLPVGNGNILLIGDTGTYKTGFLGDCPKPLIFDFDKNLGILRGKDITYETFRDLPKGLTPTATELASGLYPFAQGWGAFTKKLNEYGAQMDTPGKFQYLTLGLDSLTHLSEMALNRICSDTGAFFDKQPNLPAPHQGTWGAQQSYIKYVLGQTTAWPVRLVATVHIQRDKNDITGTIEKLPLLTGKLAGFVGTYFSEVWFCEADGLDPKTKLPRFILRTAKTPSLTQARSAANIPDGTELRWSAVKKYLE